jgi:hypothetical protein
MACAGARDRGIYSNRLRAHRISIERSVLAGLRTRLMRPDLFKTFIRQFNAELARATATANRDDDLKRQELDQVNRGIREIIEAVKAGFKSSAMAEELTALEGRKHELEIAVGSIRTPKLLMHPNLADVYRDKVANLHAALDADGMRAEAADILRELIEEVRLVPEHGELQIELRGDLAAILSFAQKRNPGARDAGMKTKLVAEERYQRQLPLLCADV